MLGPQRSGGGTTKATRNMSKDTGKVKQTNIKLALASSGQFLGAEDVLNQRNFTTTARCTSATATVYTLKTDDFFFWVGKNERTMRMMNEMFFQRDSDTKQKIRKAAFIKKLETTGVVEPPKARTQVQSPAASLSQSVDTGPKKTKKTIEISFKNKVPNIIQKNNLKMT